MSTTIASDLSDLPKIKSINPATLEVLGEVSNMSEEQVRAAVQAARAVQPQWEAIGYRERARYLLRARDILMEEMDALAGLISRENGKPIVEAIGNDIMPVMDLMTYFAKNAEKLLRKEKIRLGKWTILGRRSHLEFYPFGVVGVVSPWNFPLSIPLGEVAMALMVGNTVVLKPSEFTPLVGEKIREIFEKAKLPQDVFKLVTGDGRTGAALVNAGCDKIAFTGSVATGKKIMAACAQTLTSVTLELGGKDPFVVFEDADLDVASSAAVWGAFCNSGQVCASVERVYVHESVFEDFKNQVVQKTKTLRQGIGDSPDSDIGAMTNEAQLKKVTAHLKDARERGAKVLVGGEPVTLGKGYFFAPTVITDVDHSFPLMKEETFGPVLPLMKFRTEEEAIRLANDSDFGLNAYVWSKNRRRALAVASKIKAGTVNVNESVFTHALPQTPWGGLKLSGMGRTHGLLGLMDLVQVRHVHENKRPKKKNFFWWYGYGPDKVAMLKLLSRALFGKGVSRVGALVKFIVKSGRARVT